MLFVCLGFFQLRDRYLDHTYSSRKFILVVLILGVVGVEVVALLNDVVNGERARSARAADNVAAALLAHAPVVGRFREA